MTTAPDEAASDATTHRKPPFLRRVRIRNFKSIRFCDVTLEPLTVLVGRNGSGKSNFVEALAFLRDVVTWGAEKAVELHGGPTICFGLGGQPVVLEVEYLSRPLLGGVEIDGRVFRYLAEVSGVEKHPWRSNEEVEDVGSRTILFSNPQPSSVYPEVRELPTHINETLRLRTIRDYQFDPQQMRLPQRGAVSWLGKRGENLAISLLSLQLSEDRDWAYHRIQQYFRSVVGEVERVEAVRVADHAAIQFILRVANEPIQLFAASMSEGTLRSLAVLVAALRTKT